MQVTFSCVPTTMLAVESALSVARLARYGSKPYQDKSLALRIYVWNARICEALYLPVQIAEIATRNAVYRAVKDHYGQQWYQAGAFTCTLPNRLREELQRAIQDERAAYGSQMTDDHIISGLSFGFWVHLTTRNYDGVLWPKYFNFCFPNMPMATGRVGLYNKLDALRLLRNRIAHHKPVFDKRPTAEYQNVLDLVNWICPETKWVVQSTSRVSQTINARPD